MTQKLRLIYVYRLRAGLTQEGLAHLVGVPQESISMWENGLSIPLPHLEKLHEIFEKAGVLPTDFPFTALEGFYGETDTE